MQNDKKIPESDHVCSKVLEAVGKPKDYLMCKAMNVYDDKFRVNIYSRRYVEGIEGRYISSSYFCRYNDKNDLLTILSSGCIT